MLRHSSPAQPVEIARQAVDAARSAAENLDVSEVRDALATQAVRAAEAARDAATNVDIGEVRDTVTTEVAKANDLVMDETRERPLRSLLIALGLGALIGAAVDRMRRKRRPEKRPEPQREPWGPS